MSDGHVDGDNLFCAVHNRDYRIDSGVSAYNNAEADMSFGALSEEAKVALATGAELAGTGICSGEGGMLSEEQAANSRYSYELASGRFGYSIEKVKKRQAFHFKAGQGAKTGTGGHLPGSKVAGKIADVRGLKEGEDAVSPSRFPDFNGVEDYRRVAEEIREATDGIPIGVKMSAQHIEDDIDFALGVGIDYIIIDGRGGGRSRTLPESAMPVQVQRRHDAVKANGFFRDISAVL